MTPMNNNSSTRRNAPAWDSRVPAEWINNGTPAHGSLSNAKAKNCKKDLSILSGEDRRKAERQRERKRLDQRRLRARKRGLIAENSGSTMELPELREPFTVSPVVTLQAPSPNAANAEKENTPQTEVTEGDSNVFQHLEAIEDQLLGINAIALNNQTIARNRLSQPYCEPLRKTVPGHNIDRVLALTPQPADRHGLVAPPQPERIGSVPPIWNENICGYSTKDVAELMLFYNEYFGIVEADDEGVRRSKVIMFLSRY